MMKSTKPDFGRFRSEGRKTVRIAPEELVRTGFLPGNGRLPLTVEPADGTLDPVAWASENRGRLAGWLHEHGGVLLRGFRVESVERFEEVVRVAVGDALEYTERSSPRSQVRGNVYTSTDYPPDQEIFLHNEQSYNLEFPLRICFYCVTPAETGGETPIADSRRVYERLPKEVREPFERDGYLYVRNFGFGFGLSWEEVFGTPSRERVEAYCRERRIDFEWRPGNRLRTRQLRRAVAVHPHSGDRCWFNHLTFFHVSTLPAAVRESVERGFDEDDLPNNTYHADGSSIASEILEVLRRAYRDELVEFPWRRGDVLMLDNVLCSHGRRPFGGARKVVAAMAEPWHWDRIEA